MDTLLNFICYLIDNAEGNTITEKDLQNWLSYFLKSDYNKNPDLSRDWQGRG